MVQPCCLLPHGVRPKQVAGPAMQMKVRANGAEKITVQNHHSTKIPHFGARVPAPAGVC